MIGQRLVGWLVVTVAAGAVVILAARMLFERRMAGEIDALLADAPTTDGAVVSERDLRPLPEPVQRWLRHARVIGQRRPTAARLKQTGEFRLEGRDWMPFAATQYFTIDPPGFLWKASFDMAPLVSISGRDRYRLGEASIDMRVLSLVPVANQRGGGLNQGALLRYLGELQWFPAAMLARHITWEAIDAGAARATMTCGGVAASMTFRFAADGRLLESRAMRYNDSRRRNELWINRNDAEEDFSGLRIPSAGEARWAYASGDYPYIKWRITTLEPDRPVRY